MTTARMLQRAEPFHLEVLEKGDSLFGWMDEIGELVRYGRGEWIHAGHDAPDAIYLIRRGRVGVSVGAE
jgi:CRP-like cAMP-binding protein